MCYYLNVQFQGQRVKDIRSTTIVTKRQMYGTVKTVTYCTQRDVNCDIRNIDSMRIQTKLKETLEI